MEVEIVDNTEIVNISVVGDIEMMSIKEFKEKLLYLGQTSDKDIEIDLSKVDYIDSSGVGVLISLLKIQKKKGKNLHIRNVSDKVLDVLRLSSLSDVFNLS